MAVTQIKDGHQGGSDNQLKVNTDGSINVNSSGSGGASNVNITEVGGNAVTTTLPVSGTITAIQGSPPWSVSGSGNFAVIQPTAANLNATVFQGGAWSVGVNNFPAIQPISGTVAVTQSTSPWVISGSTTVSGTVAATQSGIWTTGRTWNLLNSTDSVNIGNFPATQSVTQGTSPWVTSGSGNFTVVQPTGTNLHTVVDSGTVAVSSVGGTVTIAGTVTATQGTSPWVTSGTSTVSGTVTALPGTPTALTIHQGAITVGTSAVRLTVAGTAPASTRVVLVGTVDSASTAKFYIGSATVTNSGATRGIQIVAGQPFIANNDAGDYYIVSDTAAQTVELMEQY